MLRRLAPALTLVAALVFVPACEDTSSAGAYIDGQSQMTDDHAFSATLFHDQGAPAWGMNSFMLRVAVPNPNDPNDEGRGVPNLEVDLAAWMSGQDHQMEVAPVVSYEGDGVYRVDGVLLDAEGNWTLDFQIVKGEIVESARFAFDLTH